MNTTEITALRCFRTVKGPGDAGSEHAFNCLPEEEQAGWRRLAEWINANTTAKTGPSVDYEAVYSAYGTVNTEAWYTQVYIPEQPQYYKWNER